ncbi:MAG: histidine triad nucleotide-binding protein [Chloroflexi bacterium RBG_16_56_11]|nr:MAG: histidine triad nucleotide-binding protein [Chloroflexi bacterium RBG_16_56_11]
MCPEKKDKDCVFCKIIGGEIPSKILYRDEDIVVFPDINPITPVHLLVVTRKHIPSLAQMSDAETALVGKMVIAANRVAREQGIAGKGYRLTINSGADSGQIVPHLHAHLMGGRQLRWDH